MTRFLHHPVKIGVDVDDQGKPRAFHVNRSRYEVVEICNTWRVDADWWKRRIARIYYKVETYKVETREGLLCDLYLDEVKGAWYLERIYD